MGTLPLRPGGEVRSPVRLSVDSADRLVNTTHRSSDQSPTNERDRPVHRLGFVMTGRFVASGELAPYTRTPALAGGTSEATVRFSNFSRGDWDRKTDVRGLACRLRADQRAAGGADVRGRSLDLVAMTAPRFIVRREEDFHVVAPRLASWLTPWFVVTRRTTLTAVLSLAWHTELRPSFLRAELAERKYFGVHTFWLEKAGTYRAMRYHWRPAGRSPAKACDLKKTILRATGENPVSFDLVVDLFDEDVPYRKTIDALRRYPNVLREAWPISRRRQAHGTRRLIGGRLEVWSDGSCAADTHPAVSDWVFNPVPAIGGFEASDDEILEARGGAYLASHARRSS